MTIQRSLVAVPARLQSSQLPNKVMADIGGKPMIQVEYTDGCEPELVASTVPRLPKTLERLGLSGQALAKPAAPAG